jgi:hypothetical protein
LCLKCEITKVFEDCDEREDRVQLDDILRLLEQ